MYVESLHNGLMMMGWMRETAERGISAIFFARSRVRQHHSDLSDGDCPADGVS